MIGPLDVLNDVIQRFDKIGIQYYLVGSLASMYYSRPRFTNDIDLVVQISTSQIANFEKEFPLTDYYCPPLEILRDEIIRKGSFNLIHQKSGFKIDVVVNKMNEFHQSEFSRRKKVQLTPDISAFIASAENIILKKLEYYKEGTSEKHLTDVQGILASEKIDLEYLELWIVKMNLHDVWAKAK